MTVTLSPSAKCGGSDADPRPEVAAFRLFELEIPPSRDRIGAVGALIACQKTENRSCTVISAETEFQMTTKRIQYSARIRQNDEINAPQYC